LLLFAGLEGVILKAVAVTESPSVWTAIATAADPSEIADVASLTVPETDFKSCKK
jgi:hypothetical protein